MRSNRDQIADALDTIDAGCRVIAEFPLETLSRSESQALLARLDEMDKRLVALDRKLLGRLISAEPAAFGGASWADVLSRRLRISPGEARRRIAEATR